MKRVDAIVIGAGLIGSAASWNLARNGASVALIESGVPNIGASGRNAGSLHFQIEQRYFVNGDQLSAEAVKIAALNRIAIDEWSGLETALGQDLSIRQDGGLMVAETADQVRLLEAKVQREQEAGLGTQLIDGDAARAIAPCLSEQIIAAGFLPEEGHADPKKLTPAIIHAAQALGVDLMAETRVEAIEPRDGGFIVTARRGAAIKQLRGERLLIAAGAWTPQVGEMANLHFPLFPVALQMNVTERIAPVLGQLLQHVGRRLSMKQALAGNILIGGGWPSRLKRSPDGRYDPAQKPEPIERNRIGNLAAAVATAPFIADLNLLRTWTAVTAVTSDQLPLVGEVPRLPGLFVAAGGSGFTLGPTFGRLIADCMLDRAEATEALSVVSPARFEHLNSFMG